MCERGQAGGGNICRRVTLRKIVIYTSLLLLAKTKLCIHAYKREEGTEKNSVVRESELCSYLRVGTREKWKGENVFTIRDSLNKLRVKTKCWTS